MEKMPVILTFDVDVELIWRGRDPDGFRKPGTLALSRYEIKSALPRVFRILEKYGNIPASFFVPGLIAEEYPDAVKEIAERGYEIGNHGYSHIYPDRLGSKEVEREEYVRTGEILEELTGKRPKGYRSPAWDFSDDTLDLLEELGFEYSSNMMDNDRIEYLEVDGRKTNIVEIPIAWVLDDAAYWLYSGKTQGKCMQPITSVENYWIKTFDVLYEEFLEEKENGIDSDISFVLTCHPQIIGRPANSLVLEHLIEHIKKHSQAEFMSISEVVNCFKQKNENKTH